MRHHFGSKTHPGIQLSLCAAALAVAFPASAQEAPAKTGEIQEVVVTASKRKESVQSVAMSVDAITADTLQKMNVQQFADIEKLSPGMSLNEADGRGQNVSLRGVTFDPDTGASPTVQIYWNETPVSTSDAFRSLFDIGRVEVLRGPQGTLRGQTSPAGAITVATRLPSLAGVEGTINQTWGSNRLSNTQAAVNVPLVEGKLAMRVAGVYDRSEGDVHNVVNGRDNNRRARGGRISLLYQPFQNVEAVLVHQQLKDNNVQYPISAGAPVPGQAGGPVLTREDRVSIVEGGYDFYNKAKLTSLNLTWDLAGHRLSYIGGFQQSVDESVRDQDITNVISGYKSEQDVDVSSRQRTHELRFESTGNRFWNYMVGAYHAKTDVSARFNQPFAFFYPAPYAPPRFVTIEGYSAPGTYGKGSAIFTNHRFALTPQDSFEFGARYQKNRSYNQQFMNVMGNVSPALTEELANIDNKRATGSASYKHEFRKGLMAYVSYAGGFRPGGAAGFVTAPGLNPSYIVYRPEKTNSFEIGVKSSWLNRRLTLNADVFQQNIKDYIGRANNVWVRTAAVSGEPKGPGPGGTYPANAGTGGINLNTNGDVIARGFEMTAIWAIQPNWRTNFGLSYVNAHYDDASLYCNDSNNDGVPDSGGSFVQPGRQISECRSNRPLTDVGGYEPGKLSMSLQSEYWREIGNVEGFVRGLARYTSPSYHQPLNQHVASFTPIDLFVGVRDPGQRWEISVWAQNLFDKSVERGPGAQRFLGGFPGGYRVVTAREERRVGVTMRYEFGH